MPITTTKTASDPNASFSWASSVSLLALQKLNLGRSVTSDERNAIERVARELRLLSEASGIDVKGSGAGVPHHLRKSFCTLVAIQERTPPSATPLRLEQAGTDFETIAGHLRDSNPNVPPAILARARQICLEILEQLNEQRPNNALA